MTNKRALPSIAASLALVLLSVPALAQSSPQSQDSVAEAARKAQAKKKPPAKPGKVITNDDLGSISAQPSVVGQVEAQGKGSAAGQPAAAGDSKPAQSEEARWRKRFGEAYHKLHQAEAELDVLQREWSKLQTQYYADPQKALMEQNNRSDVNDHQQKIDSKKKEIAQLHQAIADLEDDLRKSGGDSAWARE
jgi:chromosome segregation ATPase